MSIAIGTGSPVPFFAEKGEIFGFERKKANNDRNKHMFDASPVSRSQAKRVCSRLERFQEVEFDFSGVPWMGQGFAHQIFVVFQKEHPSIKLLPVNMNKDVEKMYRLVMASAEEG